MAFTVACAQFAPKKHDLDANLARIGSFTRQAAGEGADLVLFPETCTSGYFLEGGVRECALTGPDLTARLSAALAGLERPIDLALGFYEIHDSVLYNSAAYVEWDGSQARLVHVYRKFFLPTYGMFDEERFVASGRDLGVFDTRFGRFAFLICEDVWHSVLSTLAAAAGAQVILVPSASPARGFGGETIGNLDRYARMLRAIGEEHGVFCVNCQLVGFEGGKGFVGGSSVVDPQGRVLGSGPVGDEHLLLARVDLEEVDVARANVPLSADLRSRWSDLVRLANSLDG